MKIAPRLLILGYGNVAREFLPLLASRATWLEQELALRPQLCGIGSRRTGFFIHPAGLPITDADPATLLKLLYENGQNYENALDWIKAGQAAGADTLLELTTLNPDNGEPALSYIHAALEAGLDVVTANKGPIAHAGATLHALARSKGAHLRYEATVIDGLPLLNLAEFTLPAVGIRGWRGLLNITSAIVLRQIEEGQTLEEAIQVAQHMGVAEANPWYDLDGWDATMKTVIITNALLNANLTPAQIQRSGIRDLAPAEIVAAAQAGTPIRLVCSASSVDGVLTASIRPERLSAGDPLYAARDSSLVQLETAAMGRISIVEHDTAVIQTAYGVLSDLIAIQRARAEK